MNDAPMLLGLGVVDDIGVVGSAKPATRWQDVGVTQACMGRSYSALFGRRDATYRRLDRPSRALVLAAEAADVDGLLPREARDDTAIVLETVCGSFDSDRRFLDSLARGVVEGAVFPYTLPSASLGELAQRYRLRGPCVCLSIEPSQAGESLREARRLLEDGEARCVLAARVESLAETWAGRGPLLLAVVAVLGPATLGRPTLGPWPADGGDPFETLARALRA